MVVLALGGVTAVLGVLYALMQHDLKRLLAYHTVENIGIIFIGLGLALAFQANGMGWAAALALTAALFHVLNHSLFKSLLFFGAGAVLTATGERDMESSAASSTACRDRFASWSAASRSRRCRRSTASSPSG
jgi:hydrogenase-4 component B